MLQKIGLVSDYMLRMRKAGYNEKYRESILTNAVSIFAKKVEDERNDVRPVYRHKNWKKG